MQCRNSANTLVWYALFASEIGLPETWRDSENGLSACPVCQTQTGHADRTLKMARLPVPSVKKLGKSCWWGTITAVASFRSCLRFCASSSLRFVSLTLRDLVHQTADKKTVAYFHTRTLFWVCHLMHYTCVCPIYYFHCPSAYPVCWTLVGRANGPFSLCSVFLWLVCHVLNAQNCSNNFPVCSKLTVKFYFCRKSNRKDFIYSFMYYAIYFKTI